VDDQSVISASYRWTLKEFLDAQSIHYELLVKPKTRLFGLVDYRIFAVIVAVFSAVSLLIETAVGQAYSFEQLILILVLAFSVVYLLQPWLSRRALRQHYGQRPDRDKLVEYRIDPVEISIATEGMTSSENRWSTYHSIVRTSKGFLFYPNEDVFQWLPNHAFASQDEVERMTNLARRCSTNFSERM
jgi:membrane protein implicated in regulation of membrane protease activity